MSALIRIGSFLAIESFVVLMVGWPIYQIRSGMVNRRFLPLLWIMCPILFAVGTLMALLVATAPT